MLEQQPQANGKEIIRVPIDSIRANPYQPRKFFKRESLLEMAESIREYGVIQPITVRLVGGCIYELVAGERRLRAGRLAGLATIPAVVADDISDKDSAVIAVIENLQREDLNFLEEAEGLANLMKDYHFTQEQLASKIGKSQSAIANKLRLLRLSRPVRDMLLEHDLTERHARAILRLNHEERQKEALQKVIKGGYTVKKTEELVESMQKNTDAQKDKPTVKIRRFVRDIKLFTNTVSRAVEVMRESGLSAQYFVEEKEEGCEIRVVIEY